MSKFIVSVVMIWILALGLRLWKIDSYPLSLNWDEVTFAYNAYSVLETGKDEYGEILPLQFKSIGDYKNPMYVYLLVPLIKLFGLNELAVRIPPAVLGSLTIPLLGMIVWQLFRNKACAISSALVLAIAPWHVQFTRAGADVGVGTFFVILGIALFVRNKYLLGLVTLVGGMYAYFGERAFVPLVVGLLMWMVRLTRRELLMSLIGMTVVILPLVGPLVSEGHKGKVFMTTLLSYRPPEKLTQKLIREDGKIVYGLFHNPVVEYGLMMVDRYVNHFSPTFLFIKGLSDNRQRIVGMGMMYWSDLILLAMAMPLVAKGVRHKNWKFLILWLLVAPIPAAITRDPVHARRAFNMIYPLSILVGIGLVELWQRRTMWKILFVGVWMWLVGLYVLSYYVFTPLQTFRGSAGWQYGYKQLVEFVEPIKNNYGQIVIDTAYQGSYAYFLFYGKYPPNKYQPQARLVKDDPLGLGEGSGYDKYQFRKIFWPHDRGTSGTLFAGPPEKIPLTDIDSSKARLLKTIYFPDKSVAFYVVEVL